MGRYAFGVIALLDYGSGNLRSVQKALQKVGGDVRLTQDPQGIKGAAGVVLPGVGAFDDCIHALQRQALWQGVRDYLQTGRPFLGICVGYQALFERSEEFQSCAAGLAIFPGRVVRFNEKAGLKIPQIGWNQVAFTQPHCPLLRGIPDRSHFYFVHSYHPQPEDESIVAARTDYGGEFASMIWRDHIFATQFHPEKSQAVGLQLLANFAALAQ